MRHDDLAHNPALCAGVTEVLEGTRDVDAFLSTFTTQWRRMASQMTMRYHADAELVDDAMQCVLEEAWHLLDEPPPDMRPEGFGGLVVFRASRRFAKIMRSRTSALAGTVKIAERRSGLERTRRTMMAELGYDPSDADLVERYNADVLARNPNAGSQGGLARISDLSENAVGSVVSIDAVASNNESSSHDVLDALVGASENSDMVALADAISRALDHLDPHHRDIARVHLEHATDTGESMSISALSRACDVRAREAGEALAAFRSNLVDELDAAASSM